MNYIRLSVRRAFLAFAGAVIFCAGCAPLNAEVETPSGTGVGYHCERGESIEVLFLPEREVALVTRGGEQFELPQQAMASGFWYTNGRMGLRGEGEELKLEIGRMAPLDCQKIVH